MTKIFKGLAALAICGALTFGLTNDAQAAELSEDNLSGVGVQDLYGPPPPPRRGDWGHHKPPPPPRDDWGRHRLPPPPPPDDWERGRHRPPPPPPPPRRHKW